MRLLKGPLLSQPSAARDGRTTVIFIGGYPRSGSTLLDLLLGQVPRFFSTGELSYIWKRGMQRNEQCGCGKRFHDCDFWKVVHQDVFGGPDALSPEVVESLRRAVERLRNLPWLAARRHPGEPLDRHLDAYAQVLRRLYASIARHSGSEVIVDSSKDPLHAFVLARIEEIDLHVVHLVRDSRAVAFSHQRVKSRAQDPQAGEMRRLGPFSVAVGWILTNALVRRLRPRASSFERVRYRDLVADPRGAISSIVRGLGREPGDLGFIKDGAACLAPTHTVSGNPARFSKGEVTIRFDDEWMRRMRMEDRALVTALTWPLLLRYGFLTRRKSGEPRP